MSTVAVSAFHQGIIPAPGTSLSVGNVINAPRLAEKSIELTTCAQFGALLGKRMVWFGLTQAQERKFGFDAATNLGGKAFIIQFKASSTVLKTGKYAGQRRFGCQHQQMGQLVKRFGQQQNSCFYLLPNIGTFEELQELSGDLIGHSYLVDVAGLPNPVPPSDRQSDYHYAYLDSVTPLVTLTSKPVEIKLVHKVSEFIQQIISSEHNLLPRSKDFVRFASDATAEGSIEIAESFYKNAALIVLPGSS